MHQPTARIHYRALSHLIFLSAAVVTRLVIGQNDLKRVCHCKLFLFGGCMSLWLLGCAAMREIVCIRVSGLQNASQLLMQIGEAYMNLTLLNLYNDSNFQ